MSQDATLATPPRKTRTSLDEKELLKTPSPMMERPRTPARKSKQEFVYELWTLLSGKLTPMIECVDTVLEDGSSSSSMMDGDIVADIRTTEEIKRDGDGDAVMTEATKSGKPDFMEVTSFIRDKSVMECASRYWAVLTSFVRCRRLQKGKMRAEMKEARIILTSLVIVLFPQDTLDISDFTDIEPLSEAVYNGAKDVIEEVFRLAPPTLGATSKLRCDEAAKTIEDFLSAFSQWQRQDRSKMLDSLKNYYEEWVRSRKVLQSTSMNELQRNAVLDTVENSIRNTKNRISKLVGESQSDDICAEIDRRIESEPDVIHPPKHSMTSATGAMGAPTPTATPADSFVVEDSDTMRSAARDAAESGEVSSESPKSSAAMTTEEKLKKYGIPSKLRSGLATPSASVTEMGSLQDLSSSEEKKTGSMSDDGRMIINLDELIAEESAKKYWDDFAKEVKSGKFHRLFELLAELLGRLKKVSPSSDAAYLDEIIDVDMVRQSIEHGTIDARGFYGIFDALWTQMSRIHAPAFDKTWREWHDRVVEDMAKSDASWAQLLPNVMNRLLMKLDEIEDAIKAVAPYLKDSSKFKKDEKKSS